ncbi:transposase [Frankia sp. Cr1]|uniref:transposase n=1 Tax=Frankia sp. Cr1 TaxID=3073931 RepID=UPI002AD2817E|nr:transposase [Frankia sp. Cr1]
MPAALDPAGPTILMPDTRERETRRRATEPAAHPDGPPPDGLSGGERLDWVLNTPWGKETYKLRSCTVEPVFGQIKYNRGFTGFIRVGLSAAHSEWRLMLLSGNLMKLLRRGLDRTTHPQFAFLDRLALSSA